MDTFGKRKDGRNLTAEWTGKFGAKSAFVWNKAQFDAIDPANTSHLLGLFERSMTEYEADRPSDVGGEPNLADMTEKAIDVLANNPNGFCHSHTFTIDGYPQRGNNILGKVIEPGKTSYTLAYDKAPYTTLTYANGSGYYKDIPGDNVYNTTLYPPHGGRIENMTAVDTIDPNFHQEATVPTSAETHAGEDVAIYAGGPAGAHLFQGTVEQNVIFHVMNRKMFK